MPGTPEPIRTLMAFDFSERRVGIAVGQNLTATATPVGVVRALAKGPDWQRIGQYIREWQPNLLIVGLPLNMDGTEQTTTEAARRFGRSLSGRFNLPVEWVDERLSTREANERGRFDERGRDEDNDDLAAQVILEGWFEQQTG